MKGTAVKFLVDEISCRFKISEEVFEAIYKAIAMEKEQIIDAYENGAEGFELTAEEYYNETFKPE
jgi:hypothetical protein